jgi:hypothetical protein
MPCSDCIRNDVDGTCIHEALALVKEHRMSEDRRWPDLSKVEQALQRYDDVNWAALWETVSSNEGVSELVCNERRYLAQAQLAYYEATSDRNSKKTCMEISLPHLREFVHRWKTDPR